MILLQLCFHHTLFWLLRIVVSGALALRPVATSRAEAVAMAGLSGSAWALLLVTPALLSASTVIITAGLLLGALLGSITAYAVLTRGWVEAAIAQGAVPVGQRFTALGVPVPHLVARETRLRHLAVFGPTGSGKSTLLKQLAHADAVAPGRPGLLCIDIKDDLALDIAALLPGRRMNDVLLFDPADRAFPPAFNPFADVPPECRTLAAAELVAALRRLYEDAWGPRLEHVLRQAVLNVN